MSPYRTVAVRWSWEEHARSVCEASPCLSVQPRQRDVFKDATALREAAEAHNTAAAHRRADIYRGLVRIVNVVLTTAFALCLAMYAAGWFQ